MIVTFKINIGREETEIALSGPLKNDNKTIKTARKVDT
jgi:hypothetical protein